MKKVAAVVDDELHLLGSDVDRIGLDGIRVLVRWRAIDRSNELVHHRASRHRV